MKVSVIVTSYNQKDYLIQTLGSIMSQTVKPYEIIVCDDGSTDGSRNLIQGFRNREPGRIKPIFQDRNLGVTGNRNSGIRAARGDYVTTLDGDDLYLPQKLEKELDKALETDAPLVYSNVMYIDEQGEKTGIRYKNNQQLGGCLFEKLSTLRYPAPREVLIARSCIEHLGVQDESFPINEDFEWVARLSSRYPFATVKEPQVMHRYHSKGLSSSNRELLLETLAQVTQKMIQFAPDSIEPDKPSLIKKLNSFLNLTRARTEEYRGNPGQASRFLFKSMAGDWRRSANYDLLMRLCLPGFFPKQSRIPDPLMVGPLALPFYMVRGVF